MLKYFLKIIIFLEHQTIFLSCFSRLVSGKSCANFSLKAGLLLTSCSKSGHPQPTCEEGGTEVTA